MSDLAAQSVRFQYKNWRGETSERWATPSKFWWGKTEYHPKHQWIMTAFDHEKGAVRDFALVDCHFLGSGAADCEPTKERRGLNAEERQAAKRLAEQLTNP